MAGRALCRVPFLGVRPFFYALYLTLYLLHCAPLEKEQAKPEIPSADAEARQVLLQVQRPDMRLQIRAAWVSEYRESQIAQASGGVEVIFFDAQNQVGVQLRAERLTLDHRSGDLGLAGGVVLSFGDSLEVQSDTLVWDGRQERLRIPGVLTVVSAEGREQGRDLEMDAGADAWQLSDVVGRWSFAQDAEPVQVRASKERSQRIDGALRINYEDVELRFEGVSLRGPVAEWVPGERRAFFSGGVEGADSSGHFVAREVEVDLDARRLLARGEVESQRGAARLLAAEVEELWQQRQTLASGMPARFVQAARHIEARHLHYAHDGEVLQADSQVVFSEDGRLLAAQHLVYEGINERLSATGFVALRDPGFEGTLRGARLVFDLRDERGYLLGEPVLKRDGDGGELLLSADSLHFDLAAKELGGVGNFVLQSGELNAHSRTGTYRTEADTMTQVVLVGAVELEQRDDDGDYHSRIEADSLLVLLEGTRASKVVIPGALKGFVEMGEGRTSWLEGRGGRVWFESGRLQRVELDAEADVTYRHLGKGEVSRFRGRRMFLYFDEDGLHRVRVEGDAELVSRLVRDGDQPAINEVSGEELQIDFVEGSIVLVEIGPEIEGSYFPPKKGE